MVWFPIIYTRDKNNIKWTTPLRRPYTLDECWLNPDDYLMCMGVLWLSPTAKARGKTDRTGGLKHGSIILFLREISHCQVSGSCLFPSTRWEDMLTRPNQVCMCMRWVGRNSCGLNEHSGDSYRLWISRLKAQTRTVCKAKVLIKEIRIILHN